jgi:hypothetical protein
MSVPRTTSALLKILISQHRGFEKARAVRPRQRTPRISALTGGLPPRIVAPAAPRQGQLPFPAAPTPRRPLLPDHVPRRTIEELPGQDLLPSIQTRAPRPVDTPRATLPAGQPLLPFQEGRPRPKVTLPAGQPLLPFQWGGRRPRPKATKIERASPGGTVSPHPQRPVPAIQPFEPAAAPAAGGGGRVPRGARVLEGSTTQSPYIPEGGRGPQFPEKPRTLGRRVVERIEGRLMERPAPPGAGPGPPSGPTGMTPAQIAREVSSPEARDRLAQMVGQLEATSRQQRWRRKDLTSVYGELQEWAARVDPSLGPIIARAFPSGHESWKGALLFNLGPGRTGGKRAAETSARMALEMADDNPALARLMSKHGGIAARAEGRRSGGMLTSVRRQIREVEQGRGYGTRPPEGAAMFTPKPGDRTLRERLAAEEAGGAAAARGAEIAPTGLERARARGSLDIEPMSPGGVIDLMRQALPVEEIRQGANPAVVDLVRRVAQPGQRRDVAAAKMLQLLRRAQQEGAKTPEGGQMAEILRMLLMGQR